jgi:hypothetical protein
VRSIKSSECISEFQAEAPRLKRFDQSAHREISGVGFTQNAEFSEIRESQGEKTKANMMGFLENDKSSKKYWSRVVSWPVFASPGATSLRTLTAGNETSFGHFA